MTPLERAENAIRSTLASKYGVTVGGSEPILARAVLTAIREPIDDAVVYLLADAEAWERGSENAPHREFLMHSGKLRRDVAARLQAMIDAAIAEGE